jgi:hypothetical protein
MVNLRSSDKNLDSGVMSQGQNGIKAYIVKFMILYVQ